MGRLQDLLNSPKAKDWGYQDSRRLLSLRLDQEYRDTQPKPSTIVEPPDWENVAMELERQNASLRREVRLQGELLESVRTSVSHIQKKRRPQGDF